jgi:hypothetical protein
MLVPMREQNQCRRGGCARLHTIAGSCDPSGSTRDRRRDGAPIGSHESVTGRACDRDAVFVTGGAGAGRKRPHRTTCREARSLRLPPPAMDPQVAIIGAGTAAVAVFVIKIMVRSVRAAADLGGDSHEWLADRQRLRNDRSQ